MSCVSSCDNCKKCKKEKCECEPKCGTCHKKQSKCGCKKEICLEAGRGRQCNDCGKKDCGCKKEKKCNKCGKQECSCNKRPKCNACQRGSCKRHNYYRQARREYGDDRIVIDRKNVYDVTLDNKQGHPWDRHINTTNKAFAINGVKGKVLHVKPGQDYHFNVKQDYEDIGGGAAHHGDNQFYFTTDPAGGATKPGYDPRPLPKSPGPISHGMVKLHVHNDYPDLFYYQSRNNAYMGGAIVVDRS